MKDEHVLLRRGGRVDQFLGVFIVVAVALAFATALMSVRTSSAGAPTCGNGVVDQFEDCDPTSPSGAMCTAGEVCVNCLCTTCGNGTLDMDEQCDLSSPSGALVCPMGTVCTASCACVPLPSSTTTSTVAGTTVTTTSSPATTTTLINHFQCYEIRKSTAPTTGTVTVQDQFGTSAGVHLTRATKLCAPTNKNGEDPTAPSRPGHLKAYQDKHPGVTVANQTVVNQFGTVQLDVSHARFLMVPAAKGLASAPPPLTPPTSDHFQCYQVKNSRGAPRFTKIVGVTGADQFGPYSVDLLKPRYLCAPANKNGEDPTAPAHPDHLLCYKVRNASGKFVQRTVFTNDQFEVENNVLLTRRVELCVPSLKNPGATTTSTTVAQATTTSSTATTPTTSSSTTVTTATTSTTTSSSSTSTTLYGSPSRAFVAVVRSLLD